MSDNTSYVLLSLIICATLVSCGHQVQNRIARVAEAEAQVARGGQQ